MTNEIKLIIRELLIMQLLDETSVHAFCVDISARIVGFAKVTRICANVHY
jgi:hypothetical protein